MNSKLSAAVSDFGMLNRGDSVVVGLSGGADSMCLADILFNAKEHYGITLAAAHINHCLRGEESDSDENFVRKYCAERDIPLFVHRVDINGIAKETGESTELCARRERYSFFESLGYGKIATAHTASDAVETMLMNLSRGTALNGLCSIPPVRGNIIRPLIYFTREETEQYCKDNNIGFVTDSTNLTDDYTRNKFRHRVVAPIKEINPSFEKNVLRCIDSLRTDNDFLEQFAEEAGKGVSVDSNQLDLKRLSEYHKAVRYRVLAKYISENSTSDFEKKHIDIIEKHFSDGYFAIELPSGERLEIENGRLYFPRKKEKEMIMPAVSFNKSDGIVINTAVGTVSISVSEPRTLLKNETAADYAKVGELLQLRHRLSGDKITLRYRHCTKSLKKLYCEEKMPMEIRDALPVLSDDRGVIWSYIGGLDANREADKNTKKYIIIKTEEGKNVK